MSSLILKSSRSVISQNADIFEHILLSKDEKELRDCYIQRIIDQSDQYFKERNESCCYRFYGTITPYISNELTSEQPPEGYFQRNGWYGVLGDQCIFNPLEPIPNRFDLLDEDKWCIFLSYPSKCDNTLEFNGTTLAEGLSIYSVDTQIVRSREVIEFVTSVPHNLSIGDVIMMSGDTYNGKFQVFSLGLDNGTFKDHVFTINSGLGLPDLVNSRLYFSKLVDNIKVKYYIRKYTKIDNTPILHKTAFAKSEFADQILSYTFCDVDLCDVVDCFGKPLESVYLTIIKKPDDYFGNIQSGFDVGINNAEYDINSINYTTNNQLDNTVLCNSLLFNGDIIEFIPTQYREVVLLDIYHRFNSTIRFNANYFEGMMYKPFSEIKIRNFSPYVEDGLENEVAGIPSYAEDVGGGRFYWRDLFDYGIFTSRDGFVDPPFLNGCHYIHSNSYLYLMRQDACEDYDHGNSPYIQGYCPTRTIEIEVEDPC